MMTDLDELRDTLSQAAQSLAQVKPDPGDWPGWMSYFLEALDTQANDRRAFESALVTLYDSLKTRIEGGRW